MGLFKCSHQVPMHDMTDIHLYKDGVGEWQASYGAIISYKGHCRHCRALVHIQEEIFSYALYEFLRREKNTTELSENIDNVTKPKKETKK